MLTQVPPPLPQPRRLNSRRNPHRATNFPQAYPALPPSLSLSLELKLFSITLHHLCFTPSFSFCFQTYTRLTLQQFFKQPRGTSLKTVLFSLCLKSLALPYSPHALSALSLSLRSLIYLSLASNLCTISLSLCLSSLSLSLSLLSISLSLLSLAIPLLPVMWQAPMTNRPRTAGNPSHLAGSLSSLLSRPDEPMSSVQSPSWASESGLTAAWLTDVDLR